MVDFKAFTHIKSNYRMHMIYIYISTYIYICIYINIPEKNNYAKF